MKPGLPLLRLQGERIYQRQAWDVVSPNMFAGSVLDLELDTAYEVTLVLSDPDGVPGQRQPSLSRTVTVRTRPEPKPAANGRVFHVYPPTYRGTRDTTTTGRPRVKPGDTILVYAGTYAYHSEFYERHRGAAVSAT